MVEWFFALVDPEDTEFSQDYARQDYTVLSFVLSQEEGQFASLELSIKNPRTPLLGGLIWLWFAYSIDGEPAVPLFFGRLVGIPQNFLDERVTLQFVARPRDYGAQKEAVAEALKVLPYYDLAFVDEQHQDDLDVVLEGYPRAWHIDRVTHEVTTSDVLIGEDGVINLEETDLLYGGFEVEFNQIPLTSVDVEAIFNWDQIADGGVDITSHILANWPNEGFAAQGTITSFTLQADDWPKPGASLGSGWVAGEGTICHAVYDLQTKSKSEGLTLTIDWGSWTDIGGNTGGTSTTFNTSDQYLEKVPPGSISLPPILTDFSNDIRFTEADPDRGGPSRVASYNASSSWVDSVIPLNHLRPTLIVSYDANRPRAETIRFTMVADIQPIVTLPGEDEVEQIKLNSIRLNNPVDPPEETDGDLLPPMRDARRRSYAVTERGQQSLAYLVALAKAKLWKRSRSVQITHILTKDAALELIPEITLRKNATVMDPRIADGEALGKIIAYRFSLDGNAGRLECALTIGCAPGLGGEVTAVAGTPTYAEADVMGPDVQEFTGRYVTFDSSVAYSPALFLPNDDGVDFLTDLTAAELIEEDLTVQNPPATQRAALENGVAKPGLMQGIGPLLIGKIQGKEAVEARARTVDRILEEVPTAARFKLKNMTGAFEQDQDIAVTELKIPAMINLGGGTA